MGNAMIDIFSSKLFLTLFCLQDFIKIVRLPLGFTANLAIRKIHTGKVCVLINDTRFVN